MTMHAHRSPWIAGVLSLTLAIPPGTILVAQTPQPAAAVPPPGTNADLGWPRTVTLTSGTATLYQPQVESWVDQRHIVGWSAVSFVPTGATEPALGTIKIEADTTVALDDRVVRMDLEITEYNFKTLSPAQVKALVADVQALPPNQRVLDLDRLTAYAAKSPLNVKNVEGIKADPPMLFSSTTPAVLVNLDGDPIWSPIQNVDLKFAVNTNWDLFEHTPTKTLYLRSDQSWMQATALAGPWTAVDTLPESFSKLPADDNWKDVKAAVPGRKLSARDTPKVFVSTKPAELIALEGQPEYEAVEGSATLLWVSNTEADLFRMGRTGDFYYLVAGRWFKAASLDGPWTFATPALPDDFKSIPLEHPRSRVLASVPGTEQATEAVLLASVPRTARVNKKELKAPEVTYQGTPEFKPIEGSKGVAQAVNTDKDIVKFGDLYYMCFQGVWFMSRAATGPWEVASTIPQEIYSIPTSSSVHHVTYVTVVEDNSNDEWVTFAYVAAYTGLMIGWGCAVWGSGWYYPPYVRYGGYYPIYHPYMPTYGFGAWYNPYSGAYGRGVAAYGPYGGAGMAAAYNPRTGTYARGAAAYGPYGAAGAAQAYNPRTGTYAQTRQGANVYGNWGSSYVQRGDSWAQSAHVQNYRTGTTTGAVRTGEGGGAVARTGPGGESGAIARTGSGDVYAGKDGNVYRRSDSGGWEQNSGSGWSSVEGGQAAAQTGRAGQTAAQTGRAGQAATQTGQRPATTEMGRTTSSATQQLERDYAARAQGNQRTANRSSWQSSGATRAGAGSYGGARAGGGRRR